MNYFGFLLGAMAHFVFLLTFRVGKHYCYNKEYMVVLMTDARANFSSRFADEEGRRMIRGTEARARSRWAHRRLR